MTLSCTCFEWDGEGFAWYAPNDFTRLHVARRKRCCSCNKLIDLDSEVLKFNRIRYPISDVEEKIYGEDGEIPMAPWYMCEGCGEIFLNLDELGYCIDIELDSMPELLKDYHEMTGFRRR